MSSSTTSFQRHRPLFSAADHVCTGGRKQRQLVHRAFGADLLYSADNQIAEHHAEKSRFLYDPTSSTAAASTTALIRLNNVQALSRMIRPIDLVGTEVSG